MLLAGLLLFASCVSDPEEIWVQETGPGPWGSDHPVYLYYENRDSGVRKDLDLLVRQSPEFAFDRLQIRLETLTPDAVVWVDTLSLHSATEAPENIETKSVSYTDLKTPYRSDIQFNVPGTYRFRFTPVMPDPMVDGVIGVGIKMTPHYHGER